MNATVTCKKCGKPLGVFDGNTCADCSKIEQIRAEIEQLYTVDTVYEDVVAVDKADVLQIIDKYKGDKE